MKPLLLVVENDSGTRRLLEIFLRRESFEADAVATGNDALLLLDRVDYSVVVLDLMIPGRTGRDVLADVAARRPALLERIVVISSATEAHLRDVRGRYPAVAVLRKPFDLAELLAAVKERVALHQSPQPSDPAQTFVRRSVVCGAKAGLILRHGGETLQLVSAFGYAPAVLETFFPLSPDAPYPICAAVRHARPVWMSALSSEAAAEYPLLIPIWRENGTSALAMIPILAAGRPAGVVGWTFSEPRAFDAGEQAHFTAIADEAASLVRSSTTASSRRA
jgi:CheY-like chemotaxis protein